VGGLAPAELTPIRGRLEAFADDVFASLPRTDQRARGECYLRGLMLDGRRKSIEPMAQRLGEVHYQALHHFVAVSPWDWRPVRRRPAERLISALGPVAWAVDDTGFPKDGEHSVGVQRQYCGHARQDRQLPVWRVGQRRHRAGKLPVGLAAVCARVLG
jgi:SRSO17 transposase